MHLLRLLLTPQSDALMIQLYFPDSHRPHESDAYHQFESLPGMLHVSWLQLPGMMTFLVLASCMFGLGAQAPMNTFSR